MKETNSSKNWKKYANLGKKTFSVLCNVRLQRKKNTISCLIGSVLNHRSAPTWFYQFPFETQKPIWNRQIHCFLFVLPHNTVVVEAWEVLFSCKDGKIPNFERVRNQGCWHLQLCQYLVVVVVVGPIVFRVLDSWVKLNQSFFVLLTRYLNCNAWRKEAVVGEQSVIPHITEGRISQNILCLYGGLNPSLSLSG